MLCNRLQVGKESKHVRRDVRGGFRRQILWVINSTNWYSSSLTRLCCHYNTIWWGQLILDRAVFAMIHPQSEWSHLNSFPSVHYIHILTSTTGTMSKIQTLLLLLRLSCTPVLRRLLIQDILKPLWTLWSMSALIILDISRSCGEGIRLRSQLRTGSFLNICKSRILIPKHEATRRLL